MEEEEEISLRDLVEAEGGLRRGAFSSTVMDLRQADSRTASGLQLRARRLTHRQVADRFARLRRDYSRNSAGKVGGVQEFAPSMEQSPERGRFLWPAAGHTPEVRASRRQKPSQDYGGQGALSRRPSVFRRCQGCGHRTWTHGDPIRFPTRSLSQSGHIVNLSQDLALALAAQDVRTRRPYPASPP